MKAYYKQAYNKLMSSNDQYLTRSLGFLLADVSRLVRQRFDARAATLNLTRAQWRVLAQLRRREGIRQTALAEILEIEPITLGRHIDRLEKKDLVERRPDPTDRRAYNLHLKTAARPLMDQMRAFSELTQHEALAEISQDQAEALFVSLLQFKGNMHAVCAPLPEEATPPSAPQSQSKVPQSEIADE